MHAPQPEDWTFSLFPVRLKVLLIYSCVKTYMSLDDDHYIKSQQHLHPPIDPPLQTPLPVIEDLKFSLHIEHKHALKFRAPIQLRAIHREDRIPAQHGDDLSPVPGSQTHKRIIPAGVRSRNDVRHVEAQTA